MLSISCLLTMPLLSFSLPGLAFSLVSASFSWATLLASDLAIFLESAKCLRRLPVSPQMKAVRARGRW